MCPHTPLSSFASDLQGEGDLEVDVPTRLLYAEKKPYPRWNPNVPWTPYGEREYEETETEYTGPVYFIDQHIRKTICQQEASHYRPRGTGNDGYRNVRETSILCLKARVV